MALGEAFDTAAALHWRAETIRGVENKWRKRGALVPNWDESAPRCEGNDFRCGAPPPARASLRAESLRVPMPAGTPRPRAPAGFAARWRALRRQRSACGTRRRAAPGPPR